MNPFVGPPSPTVNFQYSMVKEPTTNTATLPSIPDQGSGIQCLFDPWIRDPGWVENQDPNPGSGSGMNNPDHFHFPAFFYSKYLNSLTPTGMKKIRIRDTGWNKFRSWIREGKNSDPGWKKFRSGIRDGKKSDPGSGINIPDPQHYCYRC
jgi:hypothetical protein